jgi:hypothetical protein
LSLKASLRNRPVIYEIVPPRRDTSRFNTELRGVEEVLADSRITAINIPELINRRESGGQTVYSPATIPPEEYAMMIKDHKEGIVNVVAPRLEKEDFLGRARRVLHEYKIPNLVLVGKERREDPLPGPGALEAIRLLNSEKGEGIALGGICIFNRDSPGGAEYGVGGAKLSEGRRVWLKAKAGCDFVTSQITFDPKPALDFLTSYQRVCEETELDPLTVFVSLTTVPSQSILSLLKSLDVVIPIGVQKRLARSEMMGDESVSIAAEVFQAIVEGAERSGSRVPLGLQVEQVGVDSDDLSLELLDLTYATLRSSSLSFG